MSDDWDKEDEEIVDAVFERKEELDAEYTEERRQYLEASKEEKLKLMCNKVERLVGLFAYHGAFRGDGTLEAMANYDWYEAYYFSEVDNKEENYIEFLKCYVNGYHNAALCCDFSTPEEIDIFIKNKCKEAGLGD